MFYHISIIYLALDRSLLMSGSKLPWVEKAAKLIIMTSILDYPARKVFVKDLTKGVRLQTQGIENGGKKKQKEWKIECNRVEFIVTVVWIQGLVTEV